VFTETWFQSQVVFFARKLARLWLQLLKSQIKCFLHDARFNMRNYKIQYSWIPIPKGHRGFANIHFLWISFGPANVDLSGLVNRDECMRVRPRLEFTLIEVYDGIMWNVRCACTAWFTKIPSSVASGSNNSSIMGVPVDQSILHVPNLHEASQNWVAPGPKWILVFYYHPALHFQWRAIKRNFHEETSGSDLTTMS